MEPVIARRNRLLGKLLFKEKDTIMKVLLVAVNAKYIHTNLAVYSIRAFSLAHGVAKQDVETAEYTINQSQDAILADIYDRQPDMLAFSCYIWNVQQIKELAAEIHKILPDVPVWVGGPEVSYQAEKMLAEYPWLTGVIVGEGEASFLELYRAYASEGMQTADGIEGPELSGVAGIVYRDGTTRKIVTTTARQKLSMDELVFPYWDMDMEGLKHRIIYYETSRGCPFGCSYCLSSVDREVRLRSMELVEKELQFFLDRKVPQVKFVDRTFNCRREHTRAIWKYLYEHDNGVTNFHFELSADLLTDEEISFVSQFRPGLVQFEIGVQSVNRDTLKAIGRTSRFDVLKERVERVKKAGNIHQHLDLIAGLPWEDYDSFRRSFNEVYDMKPEQLQLGFLKMLWGTPIFYQKEELGIVCRDKAPYEVLFTRWLSYGDMLRLKQVEDMVERYYNSMQFEASLPYVSGQFDTAFDFYQELGAYYKEKGYMGVHQSRMQNYEILLEFGREKTSCDTHILCQLMLYDLYARENLKARPSFPGVKCSDETAAAQDRERRRRFYQDDEMRKRYLPLYESYDWKQTARMTHLEYFDFDVPAYLQQGSIVERKCTLLFDYRQRNPLNRQARIVSVE